MNLRPRFSLKRLLRHGRAEVRRSLQARTVALTVILTLAVAIVFSGVSMVSVRASLLTQITSQSRADYSNMVQQAQTSLDAADVSATVQIQQLVNDLASSLQSEGPSNLIGVYLWSRDTNSRAIIPVSTEPSYQSLISDDIRSSVASDLDDSVFYQPVEIPGDSGMSGSGTPAAVLGTVLDFGVAGNLEFFAIYSYTFQQQSLTQIQLSLVVICALLSIVVGVVIWLVIRGIVRPIERVAAASETLASGNLDMRVTVDRKDELGDEGKEVTIPLDLRFSPSQNAQNFFKNYKKKQTAARMLVDLLAEGEKEIAYLETVLYEVETASGEAALNEIRAELKSQGYLKYYKQRDKRQKPADFLRFTSSDGFEILVGRNNAQNDRLTLHTARGKDLWFHVQKAPGSHVVVMSRGEDIPDTTRQEAAELAVVYSSTFKAGAAAKVAVDTTEVKNIWKANGAKPGMVLYEVYTTVYVTPREKLLDELKANAKK